MKIDFDPASPITAIRFNYAADRAPVALVEARDFILPEYLSIVRNALQANGWNAVPVTIDGKDTLQVDGFKDAGELSAYLRANHFAEGRERITPEPGDHPTRSSDEWLQDTTQKICGYSYLLADLTLTLSGGMSSKPLEAAAGGLYLAGGGLMGWFGNAKTERHVRQVAERTAKFFEEHSAKLPESCGLFHVAREKREGILPKAEEFLYRYPSQTMLSLYIMGALAMLESGRRKQGNGWDMIYGINSTVAGLASLLIPEKKTNPNEKSPEGMLAKFWDGIRKQPLQVAGYLYIISAYALGMSAYKDYKKNPAQKAYIAKFITAATYLVGDIALAWSKKDHTNGKGAFDADEYRRIIGLTAETIACQPKDMQDVLIHQVSGFLAAQPEMAGTQQDIAAALREQAHHMPRNLWAHQSSGSQGLSRG